MPTCGCIEDCTCFISEDGFFAGHPELGRNFTQVDGNGISSDPYTFNFYDQEEFRPRHGEISVPNRTIPHDNYTNVQTMNIGTATYQSPEDFLVNDPFTNRLEVFQGNYFILGATATFDQGADSTSNLRELLIVSYRGVAGVAERYISAGQTTPGGNTDPLTLSAETMMPGLFTMLAGVDAIIGAFEIYLYQNSGVPLGVTDIRIWLTQI